MKKYYFALLAVLLTAQFTMAQDYFWPLTTNLTDTKGGLVGTNHGVQFTTDAVRGNVAVFDGNSYANLPPFLFGNPEITVAVWFKMDEVRPWSRAYSLGSGDQTEPKNVMMLIPVTGAGDPVKNWFRFTITSSTGPWLDADVDTLEAKVEIGKWNHSVMIFTTDSVIGYFNNKRIIEEAYVSDLSSINDTQNALGKSFWPDAMWKGALSDLRVYKGKLSNSEVNTLYNSTNMNPTATQNIISDINPTISAANNRISVILKKSDINAIVSVYGVAGNLICNKTVSEISNTYFNKGLFLVKVEAKNIKYIQKVIIE